MPVPRLHARSTHGRTKSVVPSASEIHAMQNPVGWFEIYVQDMPRAKAFYEAVLALTLE
jgi:hypothetical protein